jgi:hypothetical protein
MVRADFFFYVPPRGLTTTLTAVAKLNSTRRWVVVPKNIT